MPVKASRITFASLEDVERQIALWSPGVLLCRKARHSFREQINATQYLDYGYWRVIYRCVGDCDVKQWQEWTLTGHVTAKGLIYPKDENGNELYLMPKGVGRVDVEGYDLIRLAVTTAIGYNEVTGTLDEEDLPHSMHTMQALGLVTENKPKRRSKNRTRPNHLRAV